MAIYVLGARVYSRKTGLWAAFLFVYFAASYQTQDSMAANTELLMVLPYVLSYYCYLRGSPGTPLLAGSRGSRNGCPWLIAAGLMAGIATLFKQVGLLLLIFFVVNESLRAIVDRRRTSQSHQEDAVPGHDVGDSRTEGYDTARNKPLSFKVPVPRLGLIALGVVLIFAALIAWLWVNGALAGFWRNAVQLGGFYINSLPATLWFKFLLFRSLGYVLLTAALWLLAGFGLGPAARLVKLTFTGRTAHQSARISGDNGLATTDVSIALWCMVSLAAVFSSGRFYGHYFILALPALSLLGARGVARLSEEFLIPLHRRRALSFAVLIALLFAFNLFRFHHRTAILAYEAITGRRTHWSREWGMSRREQNAQEVADIIRERGIAEGEPLYIWGYALDVYWRSGCIPASRYLTPYYVTGEFYPEVPASAAQERGRFWQEARSQFLDDLKRSRPRLILNVDEPIETLPYPEIVDFVHEKYKLDGIIGSDPPYQFIGYARRDDN
jgi:hypothetical protein